MEKYGVNTDTDEAKTASEIHPTRVCPVCQRKLLPLDESNVPRCPACGTKPFEKR